MGKTVMNFRNTAYWVATGIVVLEMTVGAFWDIFRTPFVRTVMEHLGYPLYMLTILGIWKLPGAIALVIPRWPRVKEWAYAGCFFTYTGAAASHLAFGDGPSKWVGPLVFSGIIVASWALRPASRRLGSGNAWRFVGPRPVLYWITTVLVALTLIPGGIAQLSEQQQNVQGAAALGYPVFLLLILGFWKIFGGITILIPRFGLVKEWAYAGIVFDLTGAAASHAFAGNYGTTGFHVYTPLILTALAVTSWATRPYSRWYGLEPMSRRMPAPFPA